MKFERRFRGVRRRSTRRLAVPQKPYLREVESISTNRTISTRHLQHSPRQRPTMIKTIPVIPSVSNILHVPLVTDSKTDHASISDICCCVDNSYRMTNFMTPYIHAHANPRIHEAFKARLSMTFPPRQTPSLTSLSIASHSVLSGRGEIVAHPGAPCL